MKDKKNMVLSIVAIVTLLVLVVGATYAYFTAQTGAEAGADVNVTTSTTEYLSNKNMELFGSIFLFDISFEDIKNIQFNFLDLNII